MTMPIELAGAAFEGAAAAGEAAAATAGALEGAGALVEGAEGLVEGAGAAAAPLEITEGVSGTANTEALISETGEANFGDLADEADGLADSDRVDDTDLLDEADLGDDGTEADDADVARQQVRAAFDEPVAEVDTDGAGTGNPEDVVPPTGGRGGGNDGSAGNGDADPAASGGEEHGDEIVDAEPVEGEGTTEIKAADDRSEADTDIQDADVVETGDPDDDTDPDEEDNPDEDADPDEEDNPDEDADPDEEGDPDDDTDPDEEDNPDEDADPDEEDNPDEDADPDEEGDPDDDTDPDEEDNPDEDADPDEEDNPDEDADPDEEGDPDDDTDPDEEDSPDEDADPDEEDNPDEDADPDEEGDPDDGWDELDELNDLHDQLDQGLDELLGLVRQRDEITARDPFSDELGVINESIEAVNERLLGVQHEIKTIQYNADLQRLDEILDVANDTSLSQDTRDYYNDVAALLRDQLTNTETSLRDYELAHPGPEYTGGRDTSVIPNELLGLHPRELLQIRDAVNGKLDELYPNREGSADDWVRTGAQPFEEYIRHIDDLLGQRDARLATMPAYARAAYLARERAAGLRRAATQGALRHLEERTRGNLEILGDRIRDMHPVDQPDHAAEHAQDIIDQSTARQGNVRRTGGTLDHIRGAISDYRHSRGLHENGTTVRLMQAEERMEARRTRMLGEQAVSKEKIGGIDADRVARHQGGNSSRQSGGNKGGSGDKQPAPKGGKAVRTARAVKRHVDTRRAHNAHKANRKKLEHKIEQIRKAHPVKYYLSPLLQVLNLHHKELAAAQADLKVARSNERATGLPVQIGGALVDKVLG